MSEFQSSDITEFESPLTFGDTLKRLTEVIDHAGMTLFAVIDHAANARAVGITMPAATVLIYGNAKGGTPIMLTTPRAALDLPLHTLVRQRADGKTVVAFHPIATLLIRAGVAPDAAARLEPAQHLQITALRP